MFIDSDIYLVFFGIILAAWLWFNTQESLSIMRKAKYLEEAADHFKKMILEAQRAAADAISAEAQMSKEYAKLLGLHAYYEETNLKNLRLECLAPDTDSKDSLKSVLQSEDKLIHLSILVDNKISKVDNKLSIVYSKERNEYSLFDKKNEIIMILPSELYSWLDTYIERVA